MKKLDPTTINGTKGKKLEDGLRSVIVGQDPAVTAISEIYQMFDNGLTEPTKPIGSFLFLGPTGSGKTRTVEATAETLLGTPRAVIKIDCGEFQHSHEIAKLIGSPPGYLGHRETHPLLSQEVLNHYHSENIKISFVLFDEIEKASDALWNLLLGILDKATLTLGDNRKVDFSRTMIFMTSNLGATKITNNKLGFIGNSIENESASKNEKRSADAARKKFTPEFLNRLDKIVVFNSLGEGEIRQILDIELRLLQNRIFTSNPARSFIFNLSNVAKEFLIHLGTSKAHGARELKRMIEKKIVLPLSNLIATNQVTGGDVVYIDCDETGPTFQLEDEKLSAKDMSDFLEELHKKNKLTFAATASGEVQTTKKKKTQ